MSAFQILFRHLLGLVLTLGIASYPVSGAAESTKEAKQALNQKIRQRAAIYNASASFFNVEVVTTPTQLVGGFNLNGIYYLDRDDSRLTLYAQNADSALAASDPGTIDQSLAPQAQAFRRGAENKLRIVWLHLTGANWTLAVSTRRNRSITQAQYDLFQEIATTWGYVVPADAEPLFSDFLYTAPRFRPAFIVGYYSGPAGARRRHYFSDGSALLLGPNGNIRQRFTQYQHWKRDSESRFRLLSPFPGQAGLTLTKRATVYLHRVLGYPIGTVALIGLPPSGSSVAPSKYNYTGPIAIYGYRTTDEETIRFPEGPVIVERADL